ncbi:hypothetical protein JCM6294_2621 [Bacteroides pyogenes DSM 20611 = JCM 6294]|uniref:Uncharacterized protein n=1 Tax=Bacteroides pyogenes DSM 20611 = JCM 6294 TaxID=1121100 RepID=W4PIP1_9BACE|nr:hypothetical protein JCM6294_2621 [Bacteroides pyogenes DSM 20611 = JCM 6294]
MLFEWKNTHFDRIKQTYPLFFQCIKLFSRDPATCLAAHSRTICRNILFCCRAS